MKIDVLIGLLFFGLVIGFFVYAGYPLMGLAIGAILLISLGAASIAGDGDGNGM